MGPSFMYFGEVPLSQREFGWHHSETLKIISSPHHESVALLLGFPVGSMFLSTAQHHSPYLLEVLCDCMIEG